MHGFLDGDIAYLILLVTDHAAKATLFDEIDGFGTKADTEDAVERSGSAATL